ncbi:MAG: sigma-54-dependent Fis family transcriptional regulator, partial [Nitrospirae bacterium]|nr:sigma-54-dependent Fis family transcriptional regulator [Nitrospirota bacterium]
MSQKRYPAFSVLLVDDEPTWLDSLNLSLERGAGITNTLLCEDSREVMDILSRHNIGLVLLDLTMPYLTGRELLRLISEHHPEIEVIILTGINQLETAIDCMKLGAFDYFVKTEEVDRIITGVLHAIRMIEMQRENQSISARLLSGDLAHPEAFSDIITTNRTMRSICQYIESIAVSMQPILISGESGVGKELAMRAIHKLSGHIGPLVCVNVAGLDDSVFADTLFGHIKGAYTGADVARKGMIEEAAEGTLFLDEIGDLSVSSQVKLLRVLHDGEYFPLGSDRSKRSKARVVVATNQDLSAKMRTGQFRKDLFYRLQIHKLHIPPLRERKEDLPLLLENFIDEASKELGKKKPAAPKELLYLLETYNFPGNIRELRAMVFDAVTRHKSGVLSIDTFSKAMGLQDYSIIRDEGRPTDNDNIFGSLDVLPKPEQAVNLLIDEALKRAKGN